MAAQAVINTAELLESILLKLDKWYTPFALLRVSKTFRDTIQRSMQLQRMMWLAPQPEHGAKKHDSDSLKDSYNPLLRSLSELCPSVHCSPDPGLCWRLQPVSQARHRARITLGLTLSLIPGHVPRQSRSAMSSWRGIKCSTSAEFTARALVRGLWPSYSNKPWIYDLDVSCDTTLGLLLGEAQTMADAVVMSLESGR